MNDTPLAVFLFLIDFDTVVFHIYQRGLGKQLIGQYGHILPDLYTRRTKIVAVRKQFSLDRLQKFGDRRMVVHTLGYHRIEIRKTPFRPKLLISRSISVEPFVERRFLQSYNMCCELRSSAV